MGGGQFKQRLTHGVQVCDYALVYAEKKNDGEAPYSVSFTATQSGDVIVQLHPHSQLERAGRGARGRADAGPRLVDKNALSARGSGPSRQSRSPSPDSPPAKRAASADSSGYETDTPDEVQQEAVRRVCGALGMREQFEAAMAAGELLEMLESLPRGAVEASVRQMRGYNRTGEWPEPILTSPAPQRGRSPSPVDEWSDGFWKDACLLMNFFFLCTELTSRLLSAPRLLSTIARDYDVVVCGGGVIGASVAYHTILADPRLRVCVVERDVRYTHASAMLSAGGIRQQFSLPANIQLSLYGLDFLRRAASDLCVPGEEPPDLQFKEQGYLFLASEQGEATLRRNHATQRAEGVDWMRLLDPDELATRFPWMDVGGVALGCLGEHSEGWFDPWALLTALRSKARSLGVTFHAGEVTGFDLERTAPGAIRAVRVADAEGGSSLLGAREVVNAAGAFAGQLVGLCGAGVAPLPVAARKRALIPITTHV
ncbi:FAD-dependent oxidoreductase domain-containing protein [Emiliania huxleyi CCMP1516]|uniref:FAD-dependent oxidoreductase domain-containing protein 1 n=4 Tax=Emiliania huxleyi TaxID=2903 RepID=A0A0D3IA11_EMIH1|nr:FAD-dependent oxidoreductase domain-containing protein [Emiliania huxleyi CCMP1516]EOD08096.1 FAD-dependent oxidoreductase domain-containing protein [Emiliania huxleyi CCMP1516]|eukprot:XP_005760525.1 FAD-dependent oxidoreductase domain-containing protein [Emiliania huxleyi CCMP1516]